MADEFTTLNQTTYDQIAPLYARRRAGTDLSFPDLRDAFAARLPRAAVIADLGCGPAADGALFARAGYRVAGIDRSAGMLAIAAGALAAETRAAEARAGQVMQADLRCLPLADASLDGIWCCAALLHVPAEDTMAALTEMRRVLRRSGHLALVTALGDGARLEPVPYAPDARRWFCYRRAGRLHEQLLAAGLRVLTSDEEPASRKWLKVLAGAG